MLALHRRLLLAYLQAAAWLVSWALGIVTEGVWLDCAGAGGAAEGLPGSEGDLEDR